MNKTKKGSKKSVRVLKTPKMFQNILEQRLVSILPKVKEYDVTLTLSDGTIKRFPKLKCVSINQLAYLCCTTDFFLKKLESENRFPKASIFRAGSVWKTGELVNPTRMYPLSLSLEAALCYISEVRKKIGVTTETSTKLFAILTNFDKL
jgi:hypothetical protein